MNGPFSSDEPDDPSQRKAPAMAVLVVLLLTGAVLVAVLPKKVDEVITLRISCTSGAEVAGAWVEAANGGSGFAERSQEGAPHEFVLEFGGPYHVNVGCGGTRQRWAVDLSSGVSESPKRTLVCQDQASQPRTCRDEPGDF